MADPLIPIGQMVSSVAPPEPLDVSVEVANLSDADLIDAVRDPTIAALAPVMPTRLLDRVATPQQAQLAVGWGINAVGADVSAFDGAGVTVAILDTGVNAAHAAFQGVQILERDFTGTGPGDQHGHGTHCVGTVLGRDVGGVRIGVARGVTNVLSGKALDGTGSGLTSWMQDAILWAADQGAHVISLSLRIDFPGAVARLVNGGYPVAAATSLALRQYGANLRAFDSLMTLLRARLAFDHGAVVIAASGNESLRRHPLHPFTIAAALPAEASGVISVGAVEPSANGFAVTEFSNTFPQVVAPGVDIVSACHDDPVGLTSMTGTSMAAPFVAGLAALWWQRRQQLFGAAVDAGNVTSALLGSATIASLAPPMNPADIGTGLVRAP